MMRKSHVATLAILLGSLAALLVKFNILPAHTSTGQTHLKSNTTQAVGLSPIPTIYKTKPLRRFPFDSYKDFVVLVPGETPQKFTKFVLAYQAAKATPSATLIYDTQTIYQHGESIPSASKILNVPFVMQLPQLPRGCEVTSLSMMLQYNGISAEEANKMKLAEAIKKDPTPYELTNGVVHFGNPNVGFVGNMYDKSQPGYGVYHGPIAQLAAQFFPHQTVDLSGSPFSAVQWAVSEGHPVLIITNATFAPLPAKSFTTWQTPEGPIRITMQEHAVVITGYDNNYVYFNNPLADTKNSKAPLADFVQAWKQMGSQAVTILH